MCTPKKMVFLCFGTGRHPGAIFSNSATGGTGGTDGMISGRHSISSWTTEWAGLFGLLKKRIYYCWWKRYVYSIILLLMCQPKPISYALLAGSSSEQPTNTKIWLSDCHILLKKTKLATFDGTRFHRLISLRCLLNVAVIRSADVEVSDKKFNAVKIDFRLMA